MFAYYMQSISTAIRSIKITIGDVTGRRVPTGGGVGAVGRPPPPVLKDHFSADCSSANILNIVRL